MGVGDTIIQSQFSKIFGIIIFSLLVSGATVNQAFAGENGGDCEELYTVRVDFVS